MAHLSLSMLGELQVSISDFPVSSFESDEVGALLAYLAMAAERAHLRATQLCLLSPEDPEQVALPNFHQPLFNLRQVIRGHTAKPLYILIIPDAKQNKPVSDYSLEYCKNAS